MTLHHTGWGEGGQWDETHFDRAWGNVLGNLKKSFESRPIDWTEWMAQMRARAVPASGASAPR